MDEFMDNMQSLTERQNNRLLGRLNEISAPFGLSLSSAAMERLQEHRRETLKSTGRVEFGEGVLEKLVRAFCTSDFISPATFEETLFELQELFYNYKNECRDLVTDDELIDAMELIYNEVARGSIEYLSGIDWGTMCQIAHTGSIRGTELERPIMTEDFDE